MGHRTLHDWFAATVELHGDQVALEVDGAALTYRELDVVSARLACGLLSSRAAPRRVGLLAARSLTAYAGYLAVQRIGATVVPLNPDFPVTRNGTIAAAADVDLVLSDAALPSDDPILSSLPLMTVDPNELLVAASEEKPAQVLVGDAQEYAYIMFTSGSTGTPKGVPIRHENISTYLEYVIDRYELGPGARVSQNFDLTADLSLFDLYTAWGSGGTLVPPRASDRLGVVRYVNRNSLTHWLSVPSTVSLAARRGLLLPDAMPSLRWSLFCGEALTLSQAQAWSAAASSSVLENLYGPTELTVSCLDHRLAEDSSQWPDTVSGTVPIGRTYPGLEHIVVDEDLGLAVPGEPGELCVRGPQRFDGYLDPAHDIGRFLMFDGQMSTAIPHDGTSPLTADHWYRTGDKVTDQGGDMVFIGRLDHQVKIRGYRVEFGEIEASLRSQPGVVDAVAVSWEDESGDVCLEAVVTGAVADPKDPLDRLRSTLPDYMVPRRVTVVDDLLLNPNGKADRPALTRMLFEQT